jgi:hypothetical protein
MYKQGVTNKLALPIDKMLYMCIYVYIQMHILLCTWLICMCLCACAYMCLYMCNNIKIIIVAILKHVVIIIYDNHIIDFTIFNYL